MVWERFTDQVIKALMGAKNWATRLHSPTVTPEHLLLALLDDEETAAAQLLRRLGLDLQRLRADLTEWLDGTTSAEPPSEPPVWTQELQRLLHTAADEARALAERRVETTHLLLGLLKDRQSFAARWFARHALPFEDLRRRLLLRNTDPSLSEPSPARTEPLLLDLTAKVEQGDVQPVSFWQRERTRLKIALLKRERQGVLLHGDPELAKLLLEQLALDLTQENLPAPLKGRRVYWVNWANVMMQGTGREVTITHLLQNLHAVTPPPVLVLGEVSHWISYKILKAVLLQGSVPAIVWATSLPRFAEENPELVAALSILPVAEPDEQETLEWLRAHKHLYEIAHRVEITDEAIQAVVQEAKQRSGRPLLIIARHLLDETCAYIRLCGVLPKELTELRAELANLHAQMQRVLQEGSPDELPSMMERALMLQWRIDNLQNSPSDATPSVTAEEVTFVAAQSAREGEGVAKLP